MKRKTAKEFLADSFRELAETKNIDKITVQDIVGNCGYSTATFYRHYKDKYDLIAWGYSRDIERILDQVGRDPHSWKHVLEDAADYYACHQGYLASLLLDTTGYDSFVRYMTEINYGSLKNKLLLSYGAGELDEKTEMLIRVYCLGTVNLTCEWILGKFSASSAELKEVYELSLPETLKRFLL